MTHKLYCSFLPLVTGRRARLNVTITDLYKQSVLHKFWGSRGSPETASAPGGDSRANILAWQPQETEYSHRLGCMESLAHPSAASRRLQLSFGCAFLLAVSGSRYRAILAPRQPRAGVCSNAS
jgi:hypothetical protein